MVVQGGQLVAANDILAGQTDLLADPCRQDLIIAGHHLDLDPQLLELIDRRLNVFFGRVEEGDKPEELQVALFFFIIGAVRSDRFDRQRQDAETVVAQRHKRRFEFSTVAASSREIFMMSSGAPLVIRVFFPW